jgi:hypothetical protein
MFYAVLGYLHAALWRVNLAVTRRVRAIHALAGERGQGTVEYVGLILLVSLLMVGMVAAMKGFNGSLIKGGYWRSWRTQCSALRGLACRPIQMASSGR